MRYDQRMKAIVDCNSFYCSCERLFRPDLRDKPVVVLSNNDGCIISRTDEAKALGVDMAVPYYQCREVMQRHRVEVFSSNYHLYGDLSMRVMDTLRALVGEPYAGLVEVYSVDEAFIDLAHLPAGQLLDFSLMARETVEQWTGIRVSVGVAPTKLLSKVANKLAKKDKQKTNCVLLLDTEEKIQEALERMPVGELWGVGSRYGTRLRDYFGIQTGWQLRQMPEEWARKNLGGVVGVRLIRELRGQPSIGMKDPLEKKDMIATTRMFGRPVFDLQPLKEAVATFTARAAEKLRRQASAASSVDVFVVTNGHNGSLYEYNPLTDHRFVELPRATALTHELIHQAMPLVEQLYRPGLKYLKAGVILGGIVPDNAIQGSLFQPKADNRHRALMDAVDNLNFSMRDDVVKYLASGLTRNWKMRQELRSKRYTTRWEELYEVRS
jgi:DNA polymerase V